MSVNTIDAANQLLAENATLKAEVARLNEQVQALAENNAMIKTIAVKLFNLGYGRGHEATAEGHYVDIHRGDIGTYHEDIVSEIIDDEGQLTDAILNEVRSQGVDMYAEHLTRKAIESGENKNHAYAYLAANFAARIRAGEVPNG